MVLSLSLLLLLLPKILIAETLTMTTVIRFCLFPGNAKRPVERTNKRYMCIAGLWVVARTSFSLLLLPFTRSVCPSATAGSVTSSRKGCFLLAPAAGVRRQRNENGLGYCVRHLHRRRRRRRANVDSFHYFWRMCLFRLHTQSAEPIVVHLSAYHQ